MKKKLYNLRNLHGKVRLTKNTIGIISAILIFVAIIFIALFFLRGRSIVKEENMPNIKTTALNCTSNYVRYPFFTYDNANSRKLNVKLIFANDILKTISLDYTLFYNNKEAVIASEAHNHAAMNISYDKNSFGPDEFDTKYTTLNNQLRMNLYSDSNKIDSNSAKYFLIDLDPKMPNTLKEYRENYAEKGLTCETTE